MSTIAEEREAIRDTLQDAIMDANIYAYWPNNVEHPAILIKPDRYELVSKDGQRVRRYEVEVLVAAVDNEEAQLLLDRFLEDEGPLSVRAAIEGDPTLGGVVPMAIFDGWSQYGGRRTEVQVFLGAIISIEIWV